MFFKAPHVIFRNGKLYFMMRVPTDLVDKFNMQYIRKSLKTTVPADAKLIAANMASKAKSAFPLLRSGILSDDQAQVLTSSCTLQRKTPSKGKSERLSDLYKLY